MIRRVGKIGLLGYTALGLLACSGIPSNDTCNASGAGQSGVNPCGGASGTGGDSATGGLLGSGGTESTGGADATGGNTTAGGAEATGGTEAAGGTDATGGADATGGTEAAGGTDATGGADATGGTEATGGATSTTVAHTSATATTWYEDFSAASLATFNSTSYATQTDTTKALYFVNGGSSGMVFSGTTLTLGGSSGGKFLVGTTDPAIATTSTYNPGGMFSLSGKTCTMVINMAADQTAGLFQVYVDNNTTSSANSVLGSASRVVNVGPANSNALVTGDNTLTFTVPATPPTASDFLQIRADSTATQGIFVINTITLTCI